MKEKMCFFLAMLLLCSMLVACAKAPHMDPSVNTEKGESEESKTQILDGADTEAIGSDQSKDPSFTAPPRDRKSFRFDRYEDFLAWMTEKENADRDQDKWGAAMMAYVGRVQDDPSVIYIPLIDGKEMTLYCTEGLSGMCFMTKEKYDLPRIWYYGFFGGTKPGDRVIFELTALVDATAELNPEAPSDTIQALDEDAPTLHNKEQYSERYEIFEERSVTLAGGTVTALVSKFKPGYLSYGDERIYYQFAYKGNLIQIRGREEILTPEFFARLDFGSIVDYIQLDATP